MVAVAVGVGINYVFTQADFLAILWKDIVDWLIFWD
jgi:hypothetical protein